MTWGRLAILVCVAEVLTMAPFATFAALLPSLSAQWELSATDAGWISGIYYVGEVLAVPLLVGLTDRVDARAIYLAGSTLAAAAALGFAVLADGFWSALGLRALAGAALAGTYMPGMRILTDRAPLASHSRLIPWYTASFGIGGSLSYWIAGAATEAFGWRAAFGVSGVVALGAIAVVAGAVERREPVTSGRSRHPLDLRPGFRNRAAMTYVLGYCGHTWELLAYRAWIVAFLTFVANRQGAIDELGLLTSIAALVNLIGVPASILGAAAARRLDLHRWIGATMAASVVIGVGLGLSPGLSFWTVTALCFLYSAVITADSATLTTGAAASAGDGEMGAVLAVHSLIGFSGGFLGPILVGMILDLGGGMESGVGWALGFAAIAAGSAGGWIAMRAVRPR